jgi:general secretion pathway protein K
MTRNRRGVALMIVLWLLVLLAGIAAALTAESRRAGDTVAAVRADLVARYAAESGIAVTIDAIERALRESNGSATARQRVLNGVALRDAPVTTLGTQRFQVAVVDVSARLDVNAASGEALARLFSAVGASAAAAPSAAAIKAYIRGDGQTSRILTALDDIRGIPGVDSLALAAALPYLTVDGDGRINRISAPPIVRASAAGELQDEPSRLLLIARGWQDGHPLTHEVQAVIAVQGDLLAVVRTRETLR